MDEKLAVKLDEKIIVNEVKPIREYVCLRCSTLMEPYSYGLGTECRCKNCGYKDPCCE